MPEQPIGDGRVLVIDDDDNVRRFFVRALTRAGFDVVEARDGADGLGRIAEAVPSVVVLDNRMPSMSGLDVVHELRRDPHTRTLPVILVTAQGEIAERVAGLGAGANDYITKPVHPEELVARVGAQLRGQAAWREAIERAWRDRAAVVERLGTLDTSAAPTPLGDAVCETLLDLPGTDAVALLRFEGNDVSVLAQRGGGAVRAGTVLPPVLGLMVRRRARGGPWADEAALQSDAAVAGRPVLSAFAPLSWRNSMIGVLALGSAPGVEAAALRAPQLATAIDLAPAVAAAIGPTLTGRDTTRSVIEQVIADKAFRPVFQPVVDLGTREIVGFEALTRFDDGASPEVRFAEAAALDLAVRLEHTTFKAALEAATQLPPGLFLSVNASPSLILERETIASVARDGTRPLVLELTEHEPVDDYGALTRVLGGTPNVKLAVDDAGAGYASLRHILALRPSYIKLDISWVRDIENDPARQALVAGINHFASLTNCRVIAEGVEKDVECEALRRLGIDLGQGFLFGHAQPVERLSVAKEPAARVPPP
jgi:EAL domain-containing protein (putative c-di-GMP-specific phosphodiesterase class I)/FixJ family two-component response regulator